MAKTAKKAPFLLSLMVKGKTSEVSKKDYATARAEQLTKEVKFNISPKMVSSMLTALDKDQGLAGENIPAEVEKAFELVTADHEAATEAQEEAQEVLNKEFEETNNAKEIQAAKEKEVFEAALVPVDDDEKEEFDELFTASENGITISEDATTEQIAQKLVSSLFINEATAWYIGDLGNALQDRGVEGVVDAICDKFDKKAATVWANMLIARKVPLAERNPNLSLTVYGELVRPKLADTPEADAKLKAKLIAEAAKKVKKGPLTAADARAMADSARTVAPSKKGNASKEGKSKAESSRPRYLVAVLEDVENQSYYTDDVTNEEIAPNFVVDLSNGTFGRVTAEGALTWVDIVTKLKEAE